MALPLLTPKMVSDRQFNRYVLICMTLGFLAVVVAGAAAAIVMNRNQQDTRWVAHTYEVERAIYHYRILFERAETTRRGYVLSRRPVFIAAYDRTVAELPRAIERVARLTADNPRQRGAIASLRDLSARQLDRTDTSVALVRAGRIDEARRGFDTDGSFPITRALRALTDRMLVEENRLLQLRDAEQARTARLFFIVVTAAGLLLLVVGLLSLIVIRRYTRDLTRAQGELRGLNENLEGAVAERTADLQRANDEIQRFAYIVSHDLRSPLVNVMGFTAELEAATKTLGTLIDRAEAEAPQIVAEEARLAAREDLPEAIGFIRSSTQKMDRLINAILRLSREGRRVLTPEPIDMTALIISIRSSMAHQVEETGTTIRIEKPLPGLVSDRTATEQVFSNLIENAIKYRKPGRPGEIVVRGRLAGGRLIYEVADNGRGIDPRDHERVFDLFRRSGVQDRPGEGIGLAHVRALVYRMGGTIGCESALDQGATFRVTLPASIANEGNA
ncbi:MAG: histidine kinase [Sphingomonadales bacterium]|nr:MAG: histidine kinase [Sphingomonadales bacterium]